MRVFLADIFAHTVDFSERYEKLIVCGVLYRHVLSFRAPRILLHDFTKHSDSMVAMDNIVADSHVEKKIEILCDTFASTGSYKNISEDIVRDIVLSLSVRLLAHKTFKPCCSCLVDLSTGEPVVFKKCVERFSTLRIKMDMIAMFSDDCFEIADRGDLEIRYSEILPISNISGKDDCLRTP